MTRRSQIPEQSVEQRTIDYYQSQQLSGQRLNAILNDTRRSNKGRYVALALAASIALISLSVILHQNILASEHTDIVLREAAMNHASKLRMDAETGSLEELQVSLDGLGFEIALPQNELFQQLALVGGRYCTISGNLAAHIKLMDPETSRQYSLFLTPYSENLKSMQSPVVDLSGVDVELWHENNVVYALASGVSQ